mmetsp:Transcript_13261/g.56043  ORF Transcript_13261/g.56043 Transcript_13261/m.56043 type:complete len:296 (+) Transcript_13261:1922-2809(+)
MATGWWFSLPSAGWLCRMNRNITLELTKHSGSMTRTVAPAVPCASLLANHSSRLYPAWSHNLSSVAILCAMIAIRRRDASVADTYHMPELSAATRKARALLRPSGPMEGSSTRSKNPCALLLSHPSDIDSTSASRYKNGKGLRIHATSVSVNKTEHPRSTNSWMMRNFCAEILCDPRASLTTLYDATPVSVRRRCRASSSAMIMKFSTPNRLIPSTNSYTPGACESATAASTSRSIAVLLSTSHNVSCPPQFTGQSASAVARGSAIQSNRRGPGRDGSGGFGSHPGRSGFANGSG